jgi:hypothetical protein
VYAYQQYFTKISTLSTSVPDIYEDDNENDKINEGDDYSDGDTDVG